MQFAERYNLGVIICEAWAWSFVCAAHTFKSTILMEKFDPFELSKGVLWI